ncbi:TolC family protein [Candidatus Thioglobus sp.]|uniref:TolC family protein n=1 Tax=Candidatus Thioglobus sp. TaxID=2026721 RepID=UPI003D122BFA
MRFFIFLALFFSSAIWAQSLPNPLSLADVLELSKQRNFSEQQQQLNVDTQKIALDDWKSQYDIQATLDLELASRNSYQANTDNSHAFIYLKKTLYDQTLEIGKDAQLSNVNDALLYFEQLQYDKTIDVMRGFFDVVLADMNYQTSLEILAVAAVKEEQVKDDYDIQNASEVDLLEKQTTTQLSQIQRIKAESKQIQTRSELAQLLNISYENRPDDVIRPAYKTLFTKKLLEFEHYQQRLTNNPKLKQLNQALLATNNQIAQEKNNLGMVISSNARLGEQAYQRNKNGKWRIGLNLSIPFGDDAEQDNKISQLQIQAKQKRISIQQYKQSLLGIALEYHLKLRSLRQIHKAVVIELDYRDLYLERARANYEMEIKSDIGDAMANYTNSERKLAENDFNYVITLKKLHHLIGEDYEI